LRLAVDGWAARRFEQVSRFGAWLDVVIDNIGRTMIWTRVSSVTGRVFFFRSWTLDLSLVSARIPFLFHRMDHIDGRERSRLALESVVGQQ
jgi:phosphatidylglycerophosphate synthase